MARSHRDAYAKAIDKVREQHGMGNGRGMTSVECPKCGTKQMISETPGRRTCIRCGYEFPPQAPKAPVTQKV